MNKHDLKTIEQNHYERENTWSTTSCYDGFTTRTPTQLKLTNIQQSVNINQKQFDNKLRNLSLEQSVKQQQLKKRINQSITQKNEISKLIVEVETSANAQLKQIHKLDKTKQWGSEMETTIKQIMLDKRQVEAKEYNKLRKQYQNAAEKYHHHISRVNYLEESIMNQKRERQRSLQDLIDELGEQIMNIQSIIESDKGQTEDKLLQFESQMIQLQQNSNIRLMNQSKTREEEHNHLTRLIQNVMNKLII